MNCTGFVWHALYKCGVSYSKIPRVADSCGHYAWSATGRSTWPQLWANQNLKRYSFSSKREMLASGILEKGDLIWCTSSSDCHLLVFWGSSSSEDKAWHSLYSGNVISTIYGADGESGSWTVLKW